MEKNTDIILTGLLILFTYLIVSCDNEKGALPLNVIPVARTVGNYKILNLSDYATEIKYIPLETNNSVLIGDIRLISYENEKIVIVDNIFSTPCYLFDSNGKFCRKVGQIGQGPNDYYTVSLAFIYDSLVFISDRQKLLIYDTNGYLIKKKQFVVKRYSCGI